MSAAALTASAAPAGADGSPPRQVAYQDLGTTHLEIFMTPDATKEQIANVRMALKKSHRLVSAFAYLDKRDAYNEFKRIFRLAPDVVAGVQASALPVSFRVKVRKPLPNNADELRSQVEGLPSVDDVVVALPAQSDEARQERADRETISVQCGSDPTRDLEAFLDVTATPEDERRVQRVLQGLPEVAKVRFISRDEALVRFRCIFGADSEPNIQPSELPASFEITVSPRIDNEDFARVVAAIPSVDSVGVLP